MAGFKELPSATARVGLAAVGIDAMAIDLLITAAGLDGSSTREMLERTGAVIAEGLGWSMAMGDLVPEGNDAAVAAARDEIADALKQGRDLHHQILIWLEACRPVLAGMWKALPGRAGATGELVRAAITRRVLIEQTFAPLGTVRHTFRAGTLAEGLSPRDFFECARAERQRGVEAAGSRSMSEDIAGALTHLRLSEHDCGTCEGRSLFVASAREALLGRRLVDDARDVLHHQIIGRRGEIFDRELLDRCHTSGVGWVEVAFLPRCMASEAGCAHCAGIDDPIGRRAEHELALALDEIEVENRSLVWSVCGPPPSVIHVAQEDGLLRWARDIESVWHPIIGSHVNTVREGAREGVLVIEHASGASIHAVPPDSSVRWRDREWVSRGQELFRTFVPTMPLCMDRRRRAIQLMQARVPRRERAVLARNAGEVVAIETRRGRSIAVVRNEDGSESNYAVRRGAPIAVGHRIRCGQNIGNGSSIDPRDQLRVLGAEALAESMVDELEATLGGAGTARRAAIELAVRVMLDHHRDDAGVIRRGRSRTAHPVLVGLDWIARHTS